MKKSLLTLVLIFTLIVVGSGLAVQAADVAVLMSEQTEEWYNEVDWDFEAEMDTIRETLEVMGEDYIEVSDTELKEENFDAKTLILPNTRRFEENQANAVRNFMDEGGTVFSIMQTSFHDENDEVLGDSEFHMRDVMGIQNYEGFALQPPAHAYIKATDHPIFDGVSEFVEMHRNWAMVIQASDDAEIIGEWYNEDQEMPSHIPNLNGAIIENAEGNHIYLGEMLFMPEAMEDQDVRTMLRNIIDYLLEQAE